MLFKSILVLLFISINTHCYGQSLSINTTGDQADPKAMLDIKSVNKGILIPRINLIDTSIMAKSSLANPQLLSKKHQGTLKLINKWIQDEKNGA